MKIEIDLDAIDSEGLSIKDAIKEAVIKDLTSQLGDKIENQIADEIRASVKNQVNSQIESMMPGFLDREFMPETNWGEKAKPTTVRNQIAETFKTQCVLSKPSSYRSDQNVFTLLIEKAMEEEIQKQWKIIRDTLNARFSEEVLLKANVALKERLGIKV